MSFYSCEQSSDTTKVLLKTISFNSTKDFYYLSINVSGYKKLEMEWIVDTTLYGGEQTFLPSTECDLERFRKLCTDTSKSTKFINFSDTMNYKNIACKMYFFNNNFNTIKKISAYSELATDFTHTCNIYGIK